MAQKPKPTRTTGPLHFEDLEPHRFEDLIRRLIYDFRPWRQLEATGRSGSDEGFDARGFEIVPDAEPTNESDEQIADDEVLPGDRDRVWLIQCKREKAITPKKLSEYLDTISRDHAGKLYGMLFAAACDFSKAARDLFRSQTRELGFAEAHLWGKGELEDMLYQPKNDDVLFTFFGFSNRIRQRSLTAEVRRRLAIKRKAMRVLENKSPLAVLMRDASDDRYPYLDKNETDRRLRNRWSVYQYGGCHSDGLHVLRHRHYAFIDDDGVGRDYAETMDAASPNENPWRIEEDKQILAAREDETAKAYAVWNELPENNRAWFEEFLILPYENIIDIDEHGDEYFKGPHIYVVQFDPIQGPFRSYGRTVLETVARNWGGRSCDGDPETRVKKFPRKS